MDDVESEAFAGWPDMQVLFARMVCVAVGVLFGLPAMFTLAYAVLKTVGVR